MTSHNLTQDELREHLKEHIEWLEDSVRSYDAGKEHESKRLAHTLRSLLHDTDKSHSVLNQVGIKDKLRYWSVLPDFGTTPTTMFMGVGMEMGMKDGAFFSRYAANLGRPLQKLSFMQWWDREPIIVKEGQVVTRRRAVLALANKDGGSHVDPKLTELERKLLKTDVMGWTSISISGATQTVIHEDTINIGGTDAVVRVTGLEGGQVSEEESDLTSPIRATVRQTAHELHGTLREQLSSLLT
jgi:hypothetical protein